MDFEKFCFDKFSAALMKWYVYYNDMPFSSTEGKEIVVRIDNDVTGTSGVKRYPIDLFKNWDYGRFDESEDLWRDVWTSEEFAEVLGGLIRSGRVYDDLTFIVDVE